MTRRTVHLPGARVIRLAAADDKLQTEFRFLFRHLAAISKKTLAHAFGEELSPAITVFSQCGIRIGLLERGRLGGFLPVAIITLAEEE